MKKIIAVSKDSLTRCNTCARHHQVDSSLSSAELFALECTFCGGQLISNTAVSQTASKFSKTSKLALGLLSASLSFGACDDEDEVIENTPGTKVIDTPTGMVESLYGGPPVGIMATEDEIKIEPAREEIPQEVYGASPVSKFVGGPIMMEPAREDIPQEDSGVPSTGEMAGTEEMDKVNKAKP